MMDAANSKTVLIVEDREMNMKLFNDVLQTHGYSTLQADDGAEVVEMTAAHQPDIILMDIQLPNISGLDVTRIIKSRDDLKHIPIVAVTAFAMNGDKEMFLSEGCDGYISKPISVPAFLDIVARFVN
jgi:two-component system cell cycle response regulator DivK